MWFCKRKYFSKNWQLFQEYSYDFEYCILFGKSEDSFFLKPFFAFSKHFFLLNFFCMTYILFLGEYFVVIYVDVRMNFVEKCNELAL